MPVAFRGSADDDLLDTSHSGRDSSHEQGRRVGRRTARSVDADPLERAHDLAERALVLRLEPAADVLVLMKGSDACRAEFQCLSGLGRDQCASVGKLSFGDTNFVELDAVDCGRVVAKRDVALSAHVRQDAVDDLFSGQVFSEDGPNAFTHAWREFCLPHIAVAEDEFASRFWIEEELNWHRMNHHPGIQRF